MHAGRKRDPQNLLQHDEFARIASPRALKAMTACGLTLNFNPSLENSRSVELRLGLSIFHAIFSISGPRHQTNQSNHSGHVANREADPRLLVSSYNFQVARASTQGRRGHLRPAPETGSLCPRPRLHYPAPSHCTPDISLLAAGPIVKLSGPEA